MKQQAYKMIAMIVLLGGVAVSAKAQCVSGGPSSVKIPFQFSANKTTLPAGEYSLRCLDPEVGLLHISSSDGKATATVLMISVEGKAQDHGRLVFRRYGNRYFLAQAWTAGTRTGLELPKSRAERAAEHELTAIKMATESVAVTARP